MASGVFNVARGRIRTYFELPGTGSAILVTLWQTMASDTVARDYRTLGEIKAANVEADFTNYERKVVVEGVVITVDDDLDRLVIRFDSQVWEAAGGSTNNALVKLITAYRPSASAADTACVPLTFHDYVSFTDGTSRTATLGPEGVYRSTSPVVA